MGGERVEGFSFSFEEDNIARKRRKMNGSLMFRVSCHLIVVSCV